ncbi:hypothetical protein BJ944DRAFT_260158 [Cunninghamella echinulata]|nr:hypothetical protein BJ944DRAFT_260158 [Cunninghamella echinulata]
MYHHNLLLLPLYLYHNHLILIIFTIVIIDIPYLHPQGHLCMSHTQKEGIINIMLHFLLYHPIQTFFTTIIHPMSPLIIYSCHLFILFYLKPTMATHQRERRDYVKLMLLRL